MGQKVHPGGLRVGIIHDWKSNWYTSNKEFAGALLEDVKIREHIYGKLSHAGLSDILIRKDKQRVIIDVYTARPGHRHRQVGCRGGRAAPRDPRHDAEERPDQHQRDQAARARREARRAVDRRAAREPRQLPAGDEALPGVGHALWRSRRQGAVRRPAGRHGDVPLGEVLRGARAAAHAARRHRLRVRRGEDDLRPHRREGLDQQGRDHARGLRGRHGRPRGTALRAGSGSPPRDATGGSRAARRPPRPGPRRPRPGAPPSSRAWSRTQAPRGAGGFDRGGRGDDRADRRGGAGRRGSGRGAGSRRGARVTEEAPESPRRRPGTEERRKSPQEAPEATEEASE